MKQRFTALDVRATVASFEKRLVGLRLQNVYDINSKTYLFKFAKPEVKELVLIESGIRLHSTQFARDKSQTPSTFCMKIRKHLRTRRLTAVRQLGVDRVVDFEFGGSETTSGYHIICEFYASGNIILTDQDYRILSLLRIVQPNENVRMAVGEVYDTTTARDFRAVSKEHLQAEIKKAMPSDNLKKLLNTSTDFGPALSEHVILLAGLNPSLKVATSLDASDDSPQLEALLSACQAADTIIKTMSHQQAKAKNEDKLTTYDEFHPLLFKQHAALDYKEFDSFDATVDEFFSAMESQKLDLKARQQEEAAIKKLAAVKMEQQGRIDGLQNTQLSNQRKAELLELNLQLADAAIMIIRNAIASTMDWKDLEDLVQEEKKRKNPIALIIHALKLQTNQITLSLSDPELEERYSDSDDSDDEDNQSTSSGPEYVDVDIYQSAFANARNYYEQKKQSAVKQSKTIAASTKALKSAEKKIRQDLKETKITSTINRIRKPYWFEKFLWFISSENFLVIAGRDAQQNEMLVRRYLKAGDIYVHADMHGAASVIVKNRQPAVTISPTTLFQAGVMSVCQSRAWDSKIVTSAYWVNHDQVSKTAPTGEYLTTGSFMIRGKKNFLPPVQLVYGFGYLFKIDETCIGNHLREKRMFQDGAENEQANSPAANENLNGGESEMTTSQPENGEATSPTELLEEETNPDNESKDVAEEDAGGEEGDETSESSSDSDDEAFPDTQIAAHRSPVVADQHATKDDKYSLDDYGKDDTDEANANAGMDNNRGQRKAYLTAKQRRDLRKGKTVSVPSPSSPFPPDEEDGEASAIDISKAEKNVPQVRGKKAKLKKIKEKYADQDEDERKERMELLGSNKGPQPKGKKSKKQAQIKAQKEKEAAARQAKVEGLPDTEKQVPAQADQTGESDKQAADAEIRQLMEEENIVMVDPDEMDNLSFLDTLVGAPVPEDIIHFAIPVCAPYSALQKYKYKVKLTPGSLKKGKAVKQADANFLNASDALPRENELIKSVPDTEAIAVMLGKVKVSAPNLEATKKKRKFIKMQTTLTHEYRWTISKWSECKPLIEHTSPPFVVDGLQWVFKVYKGRIKNPQALSLYLGLVGDQQGSLRGLRKKVRIIFILENLRTKGLDFGKMEHPVWFSEKHLTWGEERLMGVDEMGPYISQDTVSFSVKFEILESHVDVLPPLFGHPKSHPFAHLVNNELFSDVKIRIVHEQCGQSHEKTLFGHRAFLSSISPCFNAMFTNGMRETFDQEVVLKDVDPEAFEQLLSFCYTLQIVISNRKDAERFMPLADRFQISRVKEECFRVFRSELTVSNIWLTWTLADRYCNQTTMDACSRFAAIHLEQILEHPATMYAQPDLLRLALESPDGNVEKEELVYNTVVKWARFPARIDDEHDFEANSETRVPDDLEWPSTSNDAGSRRSSLSLRIHPNRHRKGLLEQSAPLSAGPVLSQFSDNARMLASQCRDSLDEDALTNNLSTSLNQITLQDSLSPQLVQVNRRFTICGSLDYADLDTFKEPSSPSEPKDTNMPYSIRQLYLPMLLECVKFPLIDKSFLVEVVEKDDMVMHAPGMKDLLLEAYRHHLLPEHHWPSPRMQTRRKIKSEA